MVRGYNSGGVGTTRHGWGPRPSRVSRISAVSVEAIQALSVSSSSGGERVNPNGAARQQLPLTAAETRVLALLPTHLTEEAIGERIGRRRSTVKTHVAHIYEKLGARSRGQAVIRAREEGLLPDPEAVAATAASEAPDGRRNGERRA